MTLTKEEKDSHDEHIYRQVKSKDDNEELTRRAT